MKTIFQSSFFPQRAFFMGQASDFSAITADLDYYMDLYNGKVTPWLAKNPDTKAALGTYNDQFVATLNDLKSIFDEVVGIGEKLHAGMTPTDDELGKVRRFNDDAGVIWGIIQQNPIQPATVSQTTTPPSTPSAATSTTPAPAGGISQAAATAAQQLIQARKGTPTPTKPVAVPPPPPATNYTTPLLVGGGIVAAIVVALVATR